MIFSPLQSIIYLTAITASVSLILPGFSIFGTSIAFVLFVQLLLLSLAIIFQIDYQVRREILSIFAITLLTAIALSLSFIVNGATSSIDIKYLATTYSNALWLLLIYIPAISVQGFINNFLEPLLIIISIMLIMGFIYFSVTIGTLFFLRDELAVSSFQDITAFHNANYLSRLLLSIMALISLIIIYTYERRGSYRSAYFIFLIVFSIMIILAESRTNLLTLAIFWLGLISILRGSKGYRYSIKKIFPIIIIIIVFAGIIFLIPTINERIFIGFGAMLQAISNDSTGFDLPLRLRSWYASFDIIKEYPMFGIGYSRMNEIMTFYGSVKNDGLGGQKAIKIHGGFLKVVNFGGLFSLLPFLFLMFYNYQISKKISLQLELSAKVLAFAKLWKLYLVILIIFNISGDSFGTPFTWITLAFLASVTIILRDNDLARGRVLCQ